MKFSEVYSQARDNIPEEVLCRFEIGLAESGMQWTILKDGAENLYLIFAQPGENLMTQGTVMTEDDFVAVVGDFWEY